MACTVEPRREKRPVSSAVTPLDLATPSPSAGIGKSSFKSLSGDALILASAASASPFACALLFSSRNLFSASSTLAASKAIVPSRVPSEMASTNPVAVLMGPTTSRSLAAASLVSTAGSSMVLPTRCQPRSPPRALVRSSSEAALATLAKASPLRMRAASASAFFWAAVTSASVASDLSLTTSSRR